MFINDPDTVREYIVTVNKGVNWQEVHNELISDTSSDSSVDSNIIPDRECECVNERKVNPRNTHYNLDEHEAKKLRKDPRIKSVDAVDFLPKSVMRSIQEANFNKYDYFVDEDSNWGLLRHTKESNPYTSTADPGLSYDYVLDGTGVDVVIIDTGIELNHPEWQDANGASRVKQIDWYSASGVSGNMPSNHYTDIHGHGTHCTGLVAGKTFGFAKNADIYIIQKDVGQHSSQSDIDSHCIRDADVYDVLLGWHQNKGTGRPTVVNMSYGGACKFFPENPVKIDTEYGPLPISGGRYRGTTHTETDYYDMVNKGLVGWGPVDGFGRHMMGFKTPSVDADIEALIDAGIIVCIAAGNDRTKHDLPGGPDYNNYVSVVFGGDTYYWYYNRGGSPSINEPGGSHWDNSLQDITSGQKDENPGFNVGCISREPASDGKDKKVNFSDSGPGVNIYVAGDQVNSAMSNTNDMSNKRSYQKDPSYLESKSSGTSMSSPNMAGLCALLLQAHPDWTPAQVRKYFESNAITTELKTTGSTSDYSNDESIHGGQPRIAYLPMNGKKPWGYSSS